VRVLRIAELEEKIGDISHQVETWANAYPPECFVGEFHEALRDMFGRFIDSFRRLLKGDETERVRKEIAKDWRSSKEFADLQAEVAEAQGQAQHLSNLLLMVQALAEKATEIAAPIRGDDIGPRLIQIINGDGDGKPDHGFVGENTTCSYCGSYKAVDKICRTCVSRFGVQKRKD
jgi:hypothetical protein